MLHVASVCTPCCMLLDVVAQSLKPVKLFSQQLPTFLLFRDHRSVAQQCWIRLQSSSNIVGAAHAHDAWFTKTYGLYPSHDALQAPTLLGVVASVCTLLPTRTQQISTLLAQQCWELLHPFAHHCQHSRNNSKHCCRNNVGSCCIRLHTTTSIHATTPNIVVATMLGVVASVCTPLPTFTQQLPTLLVQQYWELLRPFTRSLSLVLDKNVVTTLSGSSILKA